MSAALDAVRAGTAGLPYENRLWLVGGAVRDKLLEKPEPNDFDIVLEGDALKLAEFLRVRSVTKMAPVVYPRFGTAMVRVEASTIELITARRESYQAKSRKPEVERATLEEDARRRDFTVNTLLENLHTGEIRDPLGQGMADLQAKVLRTPLEPRATFFDDPLRMLRAVRFKQQLGFEFVPGVAEAIREEAARLKVISEERIRDEWCKMLVMPGAGTSMKELRDLGLLSQFAPEVLEMIGVEQGSYHHLDVWEHSLLVLDKAGPGNLTLSLGALLHDIGKPRTRSEDKNGNTRFFGHEALGADMAVSLLRRLKFSNEQIAPVALLVKNHMRLGSMPRFTDAAARRLLRDLGGEVEDLLALVAADAESLRPGLKTIDLEPIRRKLETVTRTTPARSLESPLSGEEIMELLHLQPGPEVGRVKQMLLDKVLDGELVPGDKERARGLALAARGSVPALNEERIVGPPNERSE